MSFRDAVRRRLASLLQPWLVEEPEIEVELGIINSRVTARHLSLDASSLNSYLDGSYRFAVAQVTVELFSVRFSNWSAPAFDFEVRGLNVVLSAGQPKEEERSVGGRRTWTSEDADEEKKKEVASHDPEGSDLHDLLEKMLSTSCSSSSFKNSLLNVVLAHCRLQMFNTSLEVQYPSVNEAPLCLAELKSLSVESNYYEGCFARRLMTAVLRPQKEASFVMDFTGFEVGYRLKDQSTQVVSSADLLGYARYSDLQLVDFSIHVSEWNLLLSPIDLPVLLVFVNTFSKISKRVRNGGQLWRLAATRLRRVSPKLSLYNVVEFACLWLRYLRSYECLLLMVHYADKGSLKVFIGKMCKDKKLLNSVKEFWGIISDVEKELPAEYIAQARRIARYRVAKSIIQGHEGNYISSSSGLVKIFSKAFKGLAVIWNIICRIFLWTLQFFYLTNIFQKPKVHSLLEAVSENDIPEVCFLIEFGKISISLSPISGFENDNKQIEPPVDISTSELHSFCLSIDALVLLYLNGTFEQSIFVSCGQLKVDPSHISTSSSEGHDLSPAKASKKVPPKYAKSVLWSEPAQTLVSGQPGTDAGVQLKGACYGLLKEIMGEMWLAWERTCLELDARDVDYSDNPWLLCQVKNCLMVPDLNTPDFQCSKCCMTLGKLTLSLGYQSVLSALILCYQIEQTLSLANHGQSVSASSQATTVQELPDSELGIKYDLYVGEMKKTFLKMIPEKQVQLGVFITGIDIEILSSQAGFPWESKHLNGVIGQDGFHLGLDICSIEVAVWPSSKFDIGLAKFPRSHDLEPRGSRLRDTEAIEIPGTENEKYASQGCVSLGSYMKVNGLNFTIGEMKGRKDYGFLILKPITLQLSLFRECVHSFGSTVVAFSVALHVEATGLSTFSCMDEVEDLLQVVAGLVSEVPTAFGNFDLVGRSPQTYMRHNVVFEEADTDDTNVKGAPLIDKSLMFKITSSFAFREMGMILQKARIHDGVEGYIKIEDAFVSEEKSGIPDLSSYGIGMFSRQRMAHYAIEQGGPLFIEVTALSLLARCSASSLRRITDIVSILNTSFEHTERNKRRVQETTGTPQQTKWELPKASTLNVSQLSLVLALEDDSGCFQELVIGVDIHVKLQSNDILTELVFEVSRMSIFSQIAGEQFKTGNRTPHFSSIESNGSSSRPYGNPAVTSSGIGPNHINHQNDILKHLVVSVTAEKPKNGPANLSEVWAGQGSISGFDMTVSLSEIQLISSMLSSFSATPHEEAAHESTKKRWFTDDGSDRETGVMVPDGAIVSIQDVHQHMYFAVEEGGNKYNMIGAIHYSLAGGRALFRVKHHVQRIWKSSIVWFSLISLHAKNHDGEPFRLSYRPGSSFVDISSTSENAGSLWRIISREPESSKDGIDWEPYNKLVKNTFYLVNKKSDCAVAFVRDVPEFVRKPGNPFKFKVFHDIAMVHDVATSHSYPMESSGSGVNGVPAVRHDQRQSSAQSESLPCIQIRINSVSLTIVHELLDSKDRSPLLRCCINNAKLNVQVLSSKTRVMSTSTASVSYFDSQRSEWSEFAHPVDICTFYRSRVDSRTDRRRLPVDIYCRTNEVHISLSELALDVLLFVIGKLDLAGPFAVRSSKILSNCCKVDNQSGLELICHLGEDRSIKVIRGQSASIFLRYNTSANQLVEKVSAISIQLSNSASWATSSVHLSLVKSQIVAWRTRIMSPQDSRTYPGPFVVVDISRRSEDGLKIVVSPMVRIHNETGFPLELRFRRPQENEDVFASVFLQKGDAIDDTLATFDAISSSGGLKKTLMSLSVGNFLFAFRPEVPDGSINSMSPVSAEWSDDFKGGKAVRLSGIFDKLGYKVRKALSVESMKCSFSTAYCSLKSEDAHIIDLHFLIQNIGRDIPIAQPDTNHDGSESRNSAVALREQREIFILPTVRVSNLLDSDIQVLLTETDVYTSISSVNIGKQATVSSGSTVDFYANPAIIYFTVTLAAFGSTSKPVNSGDWVKKLRKNKTDVPCLDIDLDFGGGKYFASLRLSRGPRGVLEAAIFTPYSLKNETEFSLFFFAPNQKTLSRSELETSASNIPPDVGLFLPPKSISSCFLRSHKMQLIVLQHHQSKALLDLDALSALTEISLKIEEESRVKYIVKLGVLVGPSLSKVVVPSQMVTLVPRHVVFNESSESITIRQCYLEDETTGIVSIGSKQRKALLLQSGIAKSKELNSFENFIRRHKNDVETSLLYVQFRLDKSGSSWSGPVCIASLGRFFVKFRKEPDQLQLVDNSTTEFAAVFVAEEGSVLGVHFHKPPNIGLPYRIENHLHDTSITYYQKDSAEREVLGSNSSAFYVWDDLTLSHKLVVLVNGMHLLREINLDKVRTWKPFTKLTPLRSLASHSHLEGKADQKSSQLNTIAVVRIGYEVYAEGATRVLRICEFSDSHKGDRSSQSSARIQLRLAELAVRFLEQGKEDSDDNEELHYSPLAVARLGNVDLDSVITDEQKYNLVTIQSLTVDNKWADAPFAAMLRRHQLESNDSDFPVLKVFFVPLSISSKVTQVKYSSIILQPIDLNIDEETLMRFASFWRSSLSDSTAPSRQYYFDYFEIHPVKIIANFLPGDSYSSYSSTQETLRSLIHSVVKVPTIKNMVVELNGVLVTHALITMRELFIKCAQHYSWYAMRAIYIAKGSPLLPPAFASIFDDMASSSLDVFFDPSRGLVSLPGLTLGTFKFISNCIDGRGFSGTKRYFGDLGKTLRTLGSNVLFVAVTEVSDSVLKGAETTGFDGMVRGFRQGILNLAMEPSVIGTAVMVGGPDRKIKLDRSPGVDELYIEGYLQAMLDSMYKQEYLRVRVIDDQVILKNLPPNSSLIDEIMDRVKAFLVSKALLKGDASSSSRPFRNLRGENDWKIGPTVLTLCEHLFVSFAIRALRKQTVKVSGKVLANIKWKNEETAATGEEVGEDGSSNAIVPALDGGKMRFVWQWGVGKFVLSGILAYIDGRLCRRIPNPIARRIVGGYLLSFLDKDENDK
ncbi:unnamed protein product [Linum tenue]|uniref:Vacuolar protein sorting-associated protein 13 VPS13 adaptor binding domain-containing protein n=1 Tax=Linum tenue TaxID=586396 RepID=A0AAV0R8V2_9ROSI|nr:unnamed protein product [Linum tenue]